MAKCCDFATMPNKRLKSWMQGKGFRVSIRWKKSTETETAASADWRVRMEFKRRVRAAASEMDGGEVEKGCVLESDVTKGCKRVVEALLWKRSSIVVSGLVA